METKLRPIDKIANYCKEKNERRFDPNITHDQLFLANKLHYFCWGTHKVTKIGDHGLAFKVSGLKHTGWVAITLDFMDTYRVHLFNQQGNLKSEPVGDIYADQLNAVVDSLVESD